MKKIILSLFVLVLLSYTNPISLQAADFESCNDTIPVDAGSIYNGYWSFDVTPPGNTYFEDPYSPQTNIIGAPGGTILNIIWREDQGVPFTFTAINNGAPAPWIEQIKTTVCNSTEAAHIVAGVSSGGNFTESWVFSVGSGNVTAEGDGYYSILNLAPGTNILQYVISPDNTSCPDKVTTVTLTNYNVVADAGPDTTICTNFYTMQAVDPTPYAGTWFHSTNANVVNIRSPQTLVNGIPEGPNTFYWSVDAGQEICYFTDTVVVTHTPVTQSTIQPNLLKVCDVASLQLVGARPKTGEVITWSTTSGTAVFTNPNSYVTGVSSLSNGLVTFKYTITAGTCKSESTAEIEHVTANVFAGVDTATCTPIFELNATAPAQGTPRWSTDGSASFVSVTDPKTKVTNLDPGVNNFFWNVTFAQGCVITDTVKITNNSISTPTASANVNSFCDVKDLILTGQKPTTGQTSTWSITRGTGKINDTTAYATRVDTLSPGIVHFRYTLRSSLCSSFREVEVNNNGVYALLPDDTVACKSEIILNGGAPNIGKYLWENYGSTSAQITTPNDSITKITRLDSNIVNKIRFTVTNANCQARDFIDIIYHNVYSKPEKDRQVFSDTTTIVALAPPKGAGQWKAVETTAQILNPTSPVSKVTGLVAGPNKFQWIVQQDICKSDSILTITFNQLSANAGKDTVVCIDNVLLNAVKPLYGTGVWTADSNQVVAIPQNPQTLVSKLNIGENKFYWSVTAAGTTKKDTVIVNYLPVSALAGPDEVICGTTYTLKAAPLAENTTGTWKSDGIVTILNQTSNSSEAQNIQFGQHNLYWEVKNQYCLDVDTVVVTNNYLQAMAGEDKEICKDTYQLNAQLQNQDQGTWSVFSGEAVIQNPNNPKSLISSIAQDTTLLLWTILHDICPSTDTLTIINNMVEAEAGPDDTICDHKTILNAALPALSSGKWTVTNNKITFNDDKLPNASVENLSLKENTLTWTVTKGICTAADKVTITNLLVVALAGDDFYVCDDTAQLAAEPSVLGTGNWIFPDTLRVDKADDPQTIVRDLPRGKSTLTWLVSNDACSDEDEVVVDNKKLEINAGDDQLTCEGKITLSATMPEGATGVWSVKSGQAQFPDKTNPGVTAILGSGEIVFVWEVKDEFCTTTDEVSVLNGQITAMFEPKNVGSQENAFVFENLSSEWAQHYFWNFGDGGTSTHPNPVHRFNNSGTFNVRMTAVNRETQCHDRYDMKIDVGDNECVADFSHSASGLNVTFTNTSIGELTNYHWEFNDGEFSKEKNTSHAYAGKGRYRVSLIVADTTSNCLDIVTKDINLDPDCNAKFIADIDSANTSVTFHIPQQVGEFKYNWLFGDGNWSKDKSPTHKYKAKGFYTAALAIHNEDKNCIDYYEEELIIGDKGKDISADFEAQVVDDEKNIVFFSNKSIGDNLSFKWNFNDEETSEETNPYHTFAEKGTHNVCLVAYAENGIQDIRCKNVVIDNNFAARFRIFTQHDLRTVILKDISTGNPDKWTWDFGDGTNSDEPSPSHQYIENDFYRIHLKVENSATEQKSNAVAAVAINKQGFFVTFIVVERPKIQLKSGGYPADFISSSFGKPARAVWDFGDGSPLDSSSLNPTHIFKDPGEYNVCVTVSDTISGEITTNCQLIIIGSEDIGVEDIEPYNAILSVFPNPVSNFASIQYVLPKASLVELKIVNITGQTVLSLDKTSYTGGLYSKSFDISHLKQGPYILQLNSNNGMVYKKFIITK